MTINELTNYILYIVPEAQFSIWDTPDISLYGGESSPIMLDNKCIDWLPSNSVPCPSEEQITACNAEAVSLAATARSKSQRDIAFKLNPSIVASFKVASMINPSITWTGFLDSLEENT